MNKTQKSTILALAAYLFAAVMILCALVNMFVQQANTATMLGAHLSLAAVFAMPIIAYFTLRKKQSSAEPDSDERDNIIKQNATSVAFCAVCMLLLAAGVIPLMFVGQKGSIPAVAMPVINMGIFIGAMAVYSFAVLVQYGRGRERRKTMNRAQKRTWCKLAVSILGLMVMSGALTIMKIYNLEMRDPQDHNAIRMLGLINMIPLIMILILEWRWKKIYDERDIEIARRSLYYGIIGAFIFLGAASWFLTVVTKLGSIKAHLIVCLVYLACFVWILVSSSAALIQYGRGGKDGEK